MSFRSGVGIRWNRVVSRTLLITSNLCCFCARRYVRWRRRRPCTNHACLWTLLSPDPRTDLHSVFPPRQRDGYCYGGDVCALHRPGVCHGPALPCLNHGDLTTAGCQPRLGPQSLYCKRAGRTRQSGQVPILVNHESRNSDANEMVSSVWPSCYWARL